MEYRRLGYSGLKVSPLCLGAMMFGGATPEDVSRDIVAHAREAGINFLDTADAYSQGESERIVGRAIRGERDRWVVATKVGYPSGIDQPTGADLSRNYILRAVEASLQRLGTDYIDLYYLHHDDESTSLEETMRTLADLLHQGKIRYYGVSNFRAWRLAHVVRLADALGMDRPAACQPLYNAMNRMAENELIPACHFYGVGVVPYSPLARGVLTGKYLNLSDLPEGSRAARQDRRIQQTELRPESLQLAQRIHAHAAQKGSTVGHFALNWVLHNALVDSVIVGPRTLEQWSDYMTALEEVFDAEDEALIDQLVAPGHPSTPGFTDPQYPVTGRVPRDIAVTHPQGVIR